MLQFDTIIFGRTSKKHFGQFVWIEKSHYNSRVSLHEAPTKNGRDAWVSKLLNATISVKKGEPFQPFRSWACRKTSRRTFQPLQPSYKKTENFKKLVVALYLIQRPLKQRFGGYCDLYSRGGIFKIVKTEKSTFSDKISEE